MKFMQCSILHAFIASFLMIACTNTSSNKDDDTITIDIQPFTGLSDSHTAYVVQELKKIYPHVVLLQPINLPASAYYPQHGRYRADSLIRFLNARTAKNHVTIGLTNKDISTTKNNINDWGVIGLGYCPGKACIASTYRLSKTATKTQLFKVSIHELGHTEGLPHCPEKTCFMRDAEGHNPTNEEHEFCANCTKHLQSKGWKFE